jgi:tripartite-type tricarboxylate transporter receptor subunit TctC
MSEKSTSRRNFLSGLTTTLLGLGLTEEAFSETSETRKIICPFPPGGIADKLSRVLAQEANRSNGTVWYVQNTPGAGGLIGSTQAALSPPDGKTILFSPTGVLRTQGGQEAKGSRIDPMRDLEPLLVFGAMPLVCVTRASSDRPTLRSHVERLRASQSPFVYATAGHGSTSHFMGAYVAKRLAVESLHIPYAGSAPTVNAVLGGHVPCAIVDPMLVFGQIQSGDLHPMAISSMGRDPRMPHTQTILEQGISDFEFTSWQGLLMPSGASVQIKTTTAQLFLALAKSENVQSVLHEGFIKSAPMTGQEARTFLKNDHRFYQNLMADLNIVLS